MGSGEDLAFPQREDSETEKYEPGDAHKDRHDEGADREEGQVEDVAEFAHSQNPADCIISS